MGADTHPIAPPVVRTASELPLSRWATYFLVTLLLLFFAFAGANDPLRADEVGSVQVAQDPFTQMVEILRNDVHPPFYYWVLAVWVRVAGGSEFSVRSLSGLLYLAGVVAMYRLLAERYSRQAACFGAVLYAASPLALIAAHLTRMYALMALLSILSTRYYLEFETGKKPRRLVAYWLVNALGTLTHVWFFFLLFSQLVVAPWKLRGRPLIRFLAVFALSFIPYLILWAPTLVRQIHKSTEALAWVATPTWLDLLEATAMLGGVSWLLAPALFAAWYKLKSSPGPKTEWLLPLCMFAICVGTPFVLSQWKPLFYSRFTVVGLPLLIVAATALFRDVRLYAASGSILGLTTLGLLYGVFHPVPCDGKTGAEYLEGHAHDGDLVVFTSLSRRPIEFYLHQATQSGVPKLELTSFPSEIDSHLGFEPNYNAPGKSAQLAKDAEAVAARAAGMVAGHPERRIFVVHGFHEDVDTLLRGQLLKVVRRPAAEELVCPALGSYYDGISVFGRK